MAGIITQEGCQDVLVTYSLTNIKVGLFSSAFTPGNADTLSTYTAIESAFPGYVQATPIFGGPGPDGLGGAEMQIGAATFTVTGTNTEFAFGYFVYNSTNGKLIGAELFPAPGPYDMTTTGTTLTANITVFEDPA